MGGRMFEVVLGLFRDIYFCNAAKMQLDTVGFVSSRQQAMVVVVFRPGPDVELRLRSLMWRLWLRRSHTRSSMIEGYGM